MNSALRPPLTRNNFIGPTAAGPESSTPMSTTVPSPTPPWGGSMMSGPFSVTPRSASSTTSFCDPSRWRPKPVVAPPGRRLIDLFLCRRRRSTSGGSACCGPRSSSRPRCCSSSSSRPTPVTRHRTAPHPRPQRQSGRPSRPPAPGPARPVGHPTPYLRSPSSEDVSATSLVRCCWCPVLIGPTVLWSQPCRCPGAARPEPRPTCWRGRARWYAPLRRDHEPTPRSAGSVRPHDEPWRAPAIAEITRWNLRARRSLRCWRTLSSGSPGSTWSER